MQPARRISHELKQINKKRTFSLLGFLVILAFFPVIFSSSSQQQNTRSQAASINQDSQETINANQFVTQPVQQPGQQIVVPSQQATAPSTAPPQTYTQLQEEPYSPQPSIWLFIIPIVITFFTILFY